MIIKGRQGFISAIKKFKFNTKYAIIKPNWVSINKGHYTEPEILDLFLEALPQNKIIIESYTPWRGLMHEPKHKNDKLAVDLESGKKYWEFYKKQDGYFLKTTGLDNILEKYNAKYINITDEYWNGECVRSSVIKKIVEKKFGVIKWRKFYSYIPKKIYEIKDDAVFISLAKIKLEEGNKNIMVSFSIKNLFGLIPHPSRKEPFHIDEKDSGVPQTTTDINKVYASLFPKSLWINEGIRTLMQNYCEENEYYEENKNLIFIGKDPVKTDSATCQAFNINPKDVKHIQLTINVWNN